MDLSARAFARRGNTLVPADYAAQELLERLPEGREILILIRRVRSAKHHRWYFALLDKVVKATDRWRSVDDLLDALKFELGLTEMRSDLFGNRYRAPKSVSWVKMSEDEFRPFAERSIEAIAMATGIDPTDLMREVVEQEGAL